MSVGFVGSHPPYAFSSVLPYPAPSIQEGSLIPTLRWEPHCHLCLPNFPILSPIFPSFPNFKGLFSGHPCPITAPLLHTSASL